MTKVSDSLVWWPAAVTVLLNIPFMSATTCKDEVEFCKLLFILEVLWNKNSENKHDYKTHE